MVWFAETSFSVTDIMELVKQTSGLKLHRGTACLLYSDLEAMSCGSCITGNEILTKAAEAWTLQVVTCWALSDRP